MLLEDPLHSDSEYYFAKWGSALGSAPTLSYSFQASGPLQFDAEYYDYYEWEFDLNYTLQDWIDLAAVNPDYQFDEFGAEEVSLFEKALSDWSAVTEYSLFKMIHPSVLMEISISIWSALR